MAAFQGPSFGWKRAVFSGKPVARVTSLTRIQGAIPAIGHPFYVRTAAIQRIARGMRFLTMQWRAPRVAIFSMPIMLVAAPPW